MSDFVLNFLMFIYYALEEISFPICLKNDYVNKVKASITIYKNGFMFTMKVTLKIHNIGLNKSTAYLLMEMFGMTLLE